MTNDRLCQLVGAIADGDREAFAQLFRYFAPRLKAFGLRRGADVAAAEELAQETMLTVWRKADTFDPRRATVSAWVFTIVRNKRIDLIRRERYPEADFSEASETPSEDRPPDEALSRSEAGRALRTLMKALPEAELEIVRKAFFRGQVAPGDCGGDEAAAGNGQVAYQVSIGAHACGDSGRTRMINYHPPFEMLFEYATGMLTEGVALAAATHAAMCPACRSAIGQLETVGGVLLEEIEPEAVGKDLLAAVLDKLDEPEARPTSAADALDEATRELIPPPLRGYLGRSLSDLAWRSIGWMCQEVRLPLASKGVRASLIRLGPGSPMPKHSHRGHEYTVVLAGGYKDAGEQFARGDFDVKEAADLHQPVADQDGECIGLVVLDAPVRLTGLGGRLINPFLRI